GTLVPNDAHERVGQSRVLAVCFLPQRAGGRDFGSRGAHLLCARVLLDGASLRSTETSEHCCCAIERHAVWACGKSPGVLGRLRFDSRASGCLCTTPAGAWLARTTFAKSTASLHHCRRHIGAAVLQPVLRSIVEHGQRCGLDRAFRSRDLRTASPRYDPCS